MLLLLYIYNYYSPIPVYVLLGIEISNKRKQNAFLAIYFCNFLPSLYVFHFLFKYSESEEALVSLFGKILIIHKFTTKLLYTSGPVSLKERLLYTLNKLFVKQVKSFFLLLDLDPFILQCSLHNIKYIKFTSP